MYHDELQIDSHLERSSSLPVPVPDDEEGAQRKRMLMALGILLLALAAVVLKDWDFWFPPSPEAVEEETIHKKHTVIASTPAPAPTAPLHEHKATKAPAPAQPASEIPFATTTERAALPALEVEVVAGNRHINIPAKSNSIHVDVNSGQTSAAPSVETPHPVVNAGDRVELSPQNTQNVTISVPPTYPMLARQMKVQGAVSLQVLISREGSIQELQILSGPPILATAAREAVKQWHFKPYLLNGQPVETQARVTVNFTISTN